MLVSAVAPRKRTPVMCNPFFNLSRLSCHMERVLLGNARIPKKSAKKIYLCNLNATMAASRCNDALVYVPSLRPADEKSDCAKDGADQDRRRMPGQIVARILKLATIRRRPVNSGKHLCRPCRPDRYCGRVVIGSRKARKKCVYVEAERRDCIPSFQHNRRRSPHGGDVVRQVCVIRRFQCEMADRIAFPSVGTETHD